MPEWCRWLCADHVGFISLCNLKQINLFTYCNDEPINKFDPAGNFPWLVVAVLLLCTPAGGTAFQIGTSVISYIGISIASIFDDEIKADMYAINWNPFNKDAYSTLNSNKVSFYKGVPVFRTSAGGRSGSFGAILLTKGSSVDSLMHERGHNYQLMMMGLANFGLMIGLPSFREWSNRNYYERPWEITADILGGVKGRTHSSADITRGFLYLAASSLFGPLGYFFLIGEY